MEEKQIIYHGVKARYSWGDTRHFALMGFAPTIVGAVGMITSEISYFGLSFTIGSFTLTEGMIMIPVFFLFAMLFYAGGVEWYVLCRHCPCYEYSGKEHGNEGRFYCLANWGSPKPFNYKPGHISRGGQLVFLVWTALNMFLPVLYFWNRLDYIFMQVVIVAVLLGTLRHYACSTCPNFGCILNTVQEEKREKFLAAVAAGEVYELS